MSVKPQPGSGTTKVAIHDGCYGFRHSMNPKFVAYYLQTLELPRREEPLCRPGEGEATVVASGIEQVRDARAPPMAEQERIVAILDGFDALVNDLSIGLPAEIGGRRKQYEYYRDRLLTFEEAA